MGSGELVILIVILVIALAILIFTRLEKRKIMGEAKRELEEVRGQLRTTIDSGRYSTEEVEKAVSHFNSLARELGVSEFGEY